MGWGRARSGCVVRLALAFIRFCIACYRASVWVPTDDDHPYAFARPIRAAVYDQEQEDDTYHDHSWEWPVNPEQARVPSTALMRVFDPQREWEAYAESIEYHQKVYEAEEDRP